MDLTKIEKPFGLLDAETQDALRWHGGPYERFNALGDWVDWTPDWLPSTTYRVKPAPPKPREWFIKDSEYPREVNGFRNKEAYARSGWTVVREVLE